MHFGKRRPPGLNFTPNNFRQHLLGRGTFSMLTKKKNAAALHYKKTQPQSIFGAARYFLEGGNRAQLALDSLVKSRGRGPTSNSKGWGPTATSLDAPRVTHNAQKHDTHSLPIYARHTFYTNASRFLSRQTRESTTKIEETETRQRQDRQQTERKKMNQALDELRN